MSSPSTSSQRRIKLKSSDGETFEVEEEVAIQSETIKSRMEVVPVSEVNGKTLSLVIDYCNMCLNHQISKDNKDDLLRDWALHLFQTDQSAFFDLTLAAHYLKIKSLEELTSQTVSDILKGKSSEEIKQTFNIHNSPITKASCDQTKKRKGVFEE